MIGWFLGMKKAALSLAAVPTLRRCCGVAVFSCTNVVRPLVGARTMYPVFTFLMMITSVFIKRNEGEGEFQPPSGVVGMCITALFMAFPMTE